MPAYNFEKRFAPLVESGQKVQTIRNSSRNARPGQPAYLFTGQRTKSCRKLNTGTLIDVSPIELGRHACGEPYAVIKHGIFLPEHLTHGGLDCFAQADGFQSGEEMIVYFESKSNLPFNGFLHIWKLPTR